MVNGPELQAWQLRCIEEVLALPGAKLSLVIVNGARPDVASLKDKLSRVPPRHALFALMCRLFVNPPAARRTVWRDRLPETAELVCTPLRKGKFSEYLAEPDLTAIRAHDLDFVLRFGFGIIRGEVLRVPRYGVWSFHHDDERKYRGMPAAFWPIWHDDPTSGMILQRLTDRLDGGVILRRATLRTRSGSLQDNLDQVLRAGTHFPAQVCRDIVNGHAAYLHAEPTTSAAPIVHRPTNAQILVFLAKLARNRWRSVVRALFRFEEWNIGLIDAPVETLIEGVKPAIRWLQRPQPFGYAADPFLLRDGRGGELRVLYEDFDYRSWKGDISAIGIDGRAGPPVPQSMLSAAGHRSYPYVFRHNGRLYCVPESADAGEIALYRVDTDRLTRIATLVPDVAALDATVVRHDGRWWLFHTDREAGSCERLYIRFADALEGPWLPHAQNPVKVDIRSARPGGTPFLRDGHLYRPAQDCAETYGGRVRLHRIDVLSPTEFSEEEVAVVAPDPDGPYPDGLHTVSGDGGFTVVDGKREGFIWRAFVGATRRRMAALAAR